MELDLSKQSDTLRVLLPIAGRSLPQLGDLPARVMDVCTRIVAGD